MICVNKLPGLFIALGFLLLFTSVSYAVNVVNVSAGNDYTCAVLDTGYVQCWGKNTEGSLGNGTLYNDSLIPVFASGVTNAISISAGYMHSCSVLSSGQIKCWGYNDGGMIGDGTMLSRAIPVYVSNITNATYVSTGNQFTCALLSNGKVMCWGDNTYGQLGNSSTLSYSTVPVYVAGIENAIKIDVGSWHGCAVLSDGSIKCWGANSFGKLGDGTTTTRYTPVNVSNINNAVDISLGTHHSCALLNTGEIKCWGYNYFGRLGDGTTTTRYTPVNVLGISNAIGVSLGDSYSCALLSDGGVKCWGYNYYGQLGDGTTSARYTPVSVQSVTNAVQVSAGYYHACALLNNSILRCWGKNSYGAIGNGSTSLRVYYPTRVFGYGPPNNPPSVPSGSTLNFANKAGNWLSVSFAGSTDLDGDQISYYYEFRCNSVSGKLLRSGLTSYSSAGWTINNSCGKGNTVYVLLKAYDGFNYSTNYELLTRDVVNAPPTKPDTTLISLYPDNVGDLYALHGQGSTDQDGDNITYLYEFRCGNQTGKILIPQSKYNTWISNCSCVDKNIYVYVKATDESNVSDVISFTTPGIPFSTGFKSTKRFISDNPSMSGTFGSALAISGDKLTIAVADNTDYEIQDYGGSVTIYIKNNTFWTKQSKISPLNLVSFDEFGTDIDLSYDGNVLVASSRGSNSYTGSVYVYVRVNDTWNLETEINASDGNTGDEFGYSLAMDTNGTKVVIGAPNSDTAGYDRGAVYVFEKQGSNWVEVAKLSGSTENYSYFGNTVDLSGDGNKIAIGAYGEGYCGSVYIYDYNGTSWNLNAKLYPSDSNCERFSQGALSLSEDGMYLVVGDSVYDAKSTDDGAAFVYNYNGTSWNFLDKLYISDYVASNFGYSVSISANGDTIIVSEPGHKGLNGAAYIYEKNGTQWDQKLMISSNDGTHSGNFGDSLVISNDGSLILVGDLYFYDNTNGAAYVFERYQPSKTCPNIGPVGGNLRIRFPSSTAGDKFGPTFEGSNGTKLEYQPNTTLNLTSDISNNIILGDCFVAVNISGLDYTFNATAYLYMNNSDGHCGDNRIYYSPGFVTNPHEIRRAKRKCALCEVIEKTNNFVTKFKVPHFSSYAIGSNSRLDVYDSYEGSSATPNSQIIFYANYTNRTDGNHISNANCTIYFPYDASSARMSDNGVNYNFSRSFSVVGEYVYNITCDHVNYNTLSAVDNVTVKVNAVPEFSNSLVLIMLAGVLIIIFLKKKH